MLDLSYFQNQNSNVQGFFNGGTWQTWIKPRGAKLVNIFCVGAGGGGGGGFQSASAPRGGGGGGGSGATARLTIDAKLLPDILYILAGKGGSRGVGSGTTPTNGGIGENTQVCVIPNTASASNVILRSGTVFAFGGSPGSSTSGGSSGAGSTATVIANNRFASLGTFTFQAGVSGSQGGTANATAINATSHVTGGSGGGGTGSGGQINGSGIFVSIAASTVNTDGKNGIILYKPTLFLCGGTGGGGATLGNGGNGGKGAPGCGGGGGGAGELLAGNGGVGGDGFVIITTSL